MGTLKWRGALGAGLFLLWRMAFSSLINDVCGTGKTFEVTSLGRNGVRIRLAVPGQPILRDPAVSGLRSGSTKGTESEKVTSCFSRDEVTRYQNGNIEAILYERNRTVKLRRVEDDQVLLQLESSKCTPATFASKGSRRCEAAFRTKPGEVYYGFGEHRSGTVRVQNFSKNYSDSTFYGKSRGADVLLPTFLCSLGFNFVWNLPSLGGINLDSSLGSIVWTSEATLSYDFWVSTYPSTADANRRSPFVDLFSQYAEALGKPRPMPWYATGFIQSKDRYRNQTQLIQVAAEYKRRKLPVSMIVVDWFHWKQMGDMTFDKDCWPDPAGMVADLRQMGIELMVTFWPFMGMKVSANWQDFLQNGFLVKDSKGEVKSFWGPYKTPTGNSLIDATNDAANEKAFANWYQGYGKHGIRSIWLDETEPDHKIYIRGGQWTFDKGTDKEVLPTWVHYWTAGASRVLQQHYDEFFILSRSAWLGAARDGVALWSGDITSSWEELRLAIRAGQSVGLSGIPLWTTDIGGYAGGDPNSMSFQQLIVRWFQFGAFCPLFRLHGHRAGGPPETTCGATNGANEVWNLARDEKHYDSIKAMLRLREDLRSYIKSVNFESVELGIPMMRPMFLEFPHDSECATSSVEGQFMLGSKWLVAPVTSPRVHHWNVYLPRLEEKERWIYWFNKSSYVGGGWYRIDVRDIRVFPLFYLDSATSAATATTVRAT